MRCGSIKLVRTGLHVGVVSTCLFFSHPANAQQPMPLGGEFQVNTYTTGSQLAPSVALRPDGGFVVVWDNGSNGLRGQRFAADRAPVGAELAVSSSTMGNQYFPKAVTSPTGNFVVVWDSTYSTGTDSSGKSIQARRFAADGTAHGPDFQVSSFTPGNQDFPAVARHTDGSFVVVWQSAGSPGTDTDGLSIQGQRYDSSGVPLGAEMQINFFTTGDQGWPSVMIQPDGSFVVAWTSLTSTFDTRAQRFTADGGRVGEELEVNPAPTRGGRPVMAPDLAGNFVIGWETVNPVDGLLEIQARRFAADGTALGSDFRVNSYTWGEQIMPAIAVDAKGRFVITWVSHFSYRGTDTNASIEAQAFSSDGLPLGGEFQINTYTTSYQFLPSVGVDAAGRFVVAWESNGSNGTDSSGESIQAQQLEIDLFSDGFESGDTSDWSSSLN